MATIKSFTDIPQSKVLANILPLESADMCWTPFDEKWDAYLGAPNPDAIKKEIPCWSLAALLEQFEDATGLAKEYGLWFCYDNRKSYCTKHYDNPIDACVEMILKLHELKML